jgi:hypothetical protein
MESPFDVINSKQFLGHYVTKNSGKPFKSGFKIGKVIDLTTNPNSRKPAFVMDDGSVVDIHICKLAEV